MQRRPRWDDDPASRLTWRLAAEIRADAEEDERLAALEALRSRRLADVAIELLTHGDSVTATCAGRSFSGAVVHAAGDLLSLRTPAADVDIRLTTALRLRVGASQRSAGSSRRAGAPSFKARLCEHEAGGGVVEVGCLPADVLTGTIRAVAVDHVVLEDADTTTYALLDTVAYVAHPHQP